MRHIENPRALGACFYFGSTSPAKWEEWGNLLARFQLDLEPDLESWITSIAHCQDRGWDGPGALTALSIEATLEGARNQPFLNRLSRIGKAATLLFRPPNLGELDTIDQIFGDAERLIARAKKARRHTRGGSGAGGATNRYVEKSHNCINLGPAAKLKVISKPNLPKRRNRRSGYTMPRTTSIKSIRFPSDGFASAVRCYFASCEI